MYANGSRLGRDGALGVRVIKHRSRRLPHFAIVGIANDADDFRIAILAGAHPLPDGIGVRKIGGGEGLAHNRDQGSPDAVGCLEFPSSQERNTYGLEISWTD